MAQSDETSERRRSIGDHCTEQNIDQDSCINGSLGWFLEQKHRYPVRHGNSFVPYYSGADIFRELAHSIEHAKKSVDLVMWGFDPAMPLRRDAQEYSQPLYSLVNTTNNPEVHYSGWRKEDAFGEIILKTLQTHPELKIRMVIWYNPVSHYVIKNIVGINTCKSVSSLGKDRVSIGFEPEDFTEEDLAHLALSSRSKAAAAYSQEWFQKVRWENFPERDRLAITFRNISNVDAVNQGLHNEKVANLLQKWDDIQRDLNDFIAEWTEFFAKIGNEVKQTQAYAYGQGVKEEVHRVWLTASNYFYEWVEPQAKAVRDYIENNEYAMMLSSKIQDANELTLEYYTKAANMAADFLSSSEGLSYIDALRASKHEFLEQVADLLEVVEEDVNLFSNWAERGSLLFATDHQKMALIDYEDKDNRHGYVMGHNSITNYWSQFPFVHRDVKNEMSGTPYHDFSMKVQGQVLIDLNHNFCEAWSLNRTSRLSDLDEQGITFPQGNAQASQSILPSKLEGEYAGVGQLEAARKQYEQEIENQFAAGSGRGQIVRTRPDQRFKEDGFQEKEVKDAYLQATQHANNYILIVNQYCQYPELVRHIKCWRSERKKGGLPGILYLMVGTCKPELDGQVFAAQQMANELGVGAQFTTGFDELYNKDREDKDGRRQKTFWGAWGDSARHVIAKDLEDLDIKVLFFMFYTQISPIELPHLDHLPVKPTREAVRPIVNTVNEKVGELTTDIDFESFYQNCQAKGIDLYTSAKEKITPAMAQAQDFIKESETLYAIQRQGGDLLEDAKQRTAPYVDQAQEALNPYAQEASDILANPKDRMVIPAGEWAADGIESGMKAAQNAASKATESLPARDDLKSTAELKAALREAAKPQGFELKKPWETQEAAQSGDKLPPDRIAQQPYVHAKLMLQDDMFFTLGSSNLNIRSMSIDSELNLISDDYNTAQAMRYKLLNDYSGEAFSEEKFPHRMYPYDVQGVAPEIIQEDMKKVHAQLIKIAEKNANNVKKGECIQGYIARFEDSRTALGMRKS